MASQTVVLKVGMSCGGCVGAVKRVLTNMEGVETFDIDLEQKKVTVKGNVEPDAVLQTVSKTGKKTEFWPTEPSEPNKPGDAPTSEVEPPFSSEDAEAGKTVGPTAAQEDAEAGKTVGPTAAPSSEAEEPVKAVASA